ncbi:MAG: c-type cytochrome biogenesis protein CcmI [Gammaproteobacteria bacterium]|nr:c-type cytochrome biogenesis protein CcmI [Gammaproteobacteria bacterium]MCP5424828.1 c-type cytochrome biogenesis protein CcmI [Gammaproteobacteria bacterium]MCP5458195.1 c-type cytochrome biogenesis protein CcmI [Gammaproteobacteria bacterium]
MITFWLIALAMVSVAVAFVLIPLRYNRPAREVSRDGVNADIFRERLAELDRERDEGRLDEASHTALRQELERTLLVDVPPVRGSEAHVHPRLVYWASRAALVVPALMLMIYYGTSYRDGAGDWIDLQDRLGGIVDLFLDEPTAFPAEAEKDLPDFTRVLQAKVAREGMDNPVDLYLLGRSYMELGYLDGALQMLSRAHALDSQQPDIMLAFAQAQVMANQGRLDDNSDRLLQRVLALAPDHQGALMLLGFAAMNAGQYQRTIDAWQQLLAKRDPDSEGAQVLRNGIDHARKLLADQRKTAEQPETTAAAPAESSPRLAVTVDLSPDLREKLSPEDTLFIFAKAAQGPPMPLAAVRQPVRDFPVEVTLDDSQAMMPTLKLSNFQEVVVGARISKAGEVAAKSGDLQGSSDPLKLDGGTQKVALMIDKVVP